MSQKVCSRSDHAIITEPIDVTKDLAYKEQPAQILDHMIKQLSDK